jgi:hypothetical protein
MIIFNKCQGCLGNILVQSKGELFLDHVVLTEGIFNSKIVPFHVGRLCDYTSIGPGAV